MPSNLYKTICILVLVFFVLSAGTLAVLAEDSKQDQTEALQQELEAIEAEIEKYEKELSTVQSSKNSLQRQINALKIQQSKIKLEIEKTNLNIDNIENRLESIRADIESHRAEIENSQEQIARLIRLVNKKDHYSSLEILIMQPSFGDFFKELADYNRLILSLKTVVAELNEQTQILQRQGEQLSAEREDQSNLIAIASLQNSKLSQNIASQRDLLATTNAEESNYQVILADQARRAADIKGRIYDLLGISQDITFGEALRIAQWAGAQTEVRTIFLLAILTQESNLGKNVGTCNRLGDPPEKGWRKIMKPERDQEPFLIITRELDMDADITPVSCPMHDRQGKQIGWGGAMGPAQFIPSTWMGYKDKVTAVTGQPANPWDIRDAFLASAILLRDNGAAQVGGEWAAAMRYFSGGTNPAYSFYGDNVLAIAEGYEQDIVDLDF
ncbi:TPA: hypothetical protein DCL28_02740 [Candidatus Komeilibacteria bacterium]|nr:MAG: hypothetical protein A3J95_01665 [Candidatus Komeilibacteria bacterium RIFOXYC2_FULL_45_12]OGY94229.1 MAG: hypothetical protein A2260_02750 [Candidatus Komeilibacteria bacterium RIFOXYA2_FULL_45_9]HAH04452.1 hypothetical protein [Candidatus Komeilibacteria bacterium]HCC73432.1 hypothetical protein [Candidatus Komeilibacteria bacterium]